MNIEHVRRIIVGNLGVSGRLLSQSKSSYRSAYPKNVVYFNANLFAKDGEGWTKVWYGDIDLTLDENRIKTISVEIDMELCVLSEFDGRFEHEDKPVMENLVYKTDGIECQWANFKRDSDNRLIK